MQNHLIDDTLIGTITPIQIGPGSHGDEWGNSIFHRALELDPCYHMQFSVIPRTLFSSTVEMDL